MKLVAQKSALVAALMAFSASALAISGGSAVAGDAFGAFANTIFAWLQGGLGIGLALVALLVGAGLGISKGSPMLMLGGVVMAAGFAFLPGILYDLISTGTSITMMVPGLI